MAKKMKNGKLDVFHKPIPLPEDPILQFEINSELSLLYKVI